jgi:hypothetical protein
MELDAMKGLKEETLSAEKYAELAKKWNEDPEVARELALNKAKEQAINHFAGHEQELKAAMDKMSKVKTKVKETEGVVDMFKKPGNPMKDKSFRERLLPGIALQIQRKDNTWVDFNPYIGYRINGRFTAGAGWNERISFSFKSKSFFSQEHIYGPRLYAEFKLKDFLMLKAETEWMNTWIDSALPAYRVEVNRRAWVWSSFAGVKNVFNLSKRVKGNVQILYNLHDPKKISPYSNRLNIRFGFEFPGKARDISHQRNIVSN